MRKISIISITIFILIGILTFVTINNYSELSKDTFSKDQSLALASDNLNGNELKEILEKEYGQNYAEKLKKNNIATNLAQKIEQNFTQNNNNFLKYYGGNYINNNNELVVKVLKNHNLDLNEYSENIKIEYVEFSLKELENINNEIIKYFTSNPVKEFFVSNYIDVLGNQVVVELKNNTFEEQQWFKSNVVDSNIIKFVQNEETPTLTTAFKAGSGISALNGQNFCTIGYRAKLSGKVGYVTAAHCYANNGVGDGIANYGTIKKKQFSGSIDAAFVELYSTNTISNSINNPAYQTTTLGTTTIGYLTNGTAIAKSGITTGATTGTITSVSYSTTLNGVYFTNLVLTTALCNNGDSGGPVYTPGTSANTTGNLVGIATAKTGSGSAAGNLIFTKASLINSTFGITRY